jgi:hypothetical protein
MTPTMAPILAASTRSIKPFASTLPEREQQR